MTPYAPLLPLIQRNIVLCRLARRPGGMHARGLLTSCLTEGSWKPIRITLWLLRSGLMRVDWSLRCYPTVYGNMLVRGECT